MTFCCPKCRVNICSGLSHKEFLIVDNELALKGVMICRCPNCKEKIRLHIEGIITQVTPSLT